MSYAQSAIAKLPPNRIGLGLGGNKLMNEADGRDVANEAVQAGPTKTKKDDDKTIQEPDQHMESPVSADRDMIKTNSMLMPFVAAKQREEPPQPPQPRTSIKDRLKRLRARRGEKVASQELYYNFWKGFEHRAND